MELDKRIMLGKRPLNCFDVEEAKQFIGKKCYFSDDARDFMDLDKADGDTLFYVAELQNIWTAEEHCFADNSNDYRFILPFEWVKEEKKESEYRPYTLTEFLKKFTIGRPIKFRRKSNSKHEHLLMFGGYFTHDDGYIEIILGRYSFSLMELFKYYEWQDSNGDWQPFGVQETNRT